MLCIKDLAELRNKKARCLKIKLSVAVTEDQVDRSAKPYGKHQLKLMFTVFTLTLLN